MNKFEIQPTLQLAQSSQLELIDYQNITQQVIEGVKETSKRYDKMLDQVSEGWRT